MQEIFFKAGVQKPDVGCQHCGKILHQIVYKSDSALVYTPRYENCECSEAIEQRRVDALLVIKIAEREKLQKHREIVDRLMRDSGIKGRYLKKNLENYTIPPGDKNALEMALRYVQKFSKLRKSGNGLYLTGICGVGKTHLATGIALSLIEQEYKVICKPSVTMLADIKATYDDNNNLNEYELLKDYLRADLLIIDDLGKELITDWSLSMLYTILNMRYEDCRSIIVTTNYTDAELIERLSRKGDRVTAVSMVSRLHEISYDVPVKGIDFRCGK